MWIRHVDQLLGTQTTAPGNLPDAQQLADLGQLASISFGQGTLLASPVQVAAGVNVFANGGRYIEPTFAEGIVNEYSKQLQRVCMRRFSGRRSARTQRKRSKKC